MRTGKECANKTHSRSLIKKRTVYLLDEKSTYLDQGQKPLNSQHLLLRNHYGALERQPVKRNKAVDVLHAKNAGWTPLLALPSQSGADPRLNPWQASIVYSNQHKQY